MKFEEKGESLKSSAVRGSFWNGLSSLAQKIGGLLFTIIIARAFLPEGFGIYSLALSIMLIFATLVRGGMHNALIRYISEAIKERDKKKEISVFKYILKIKLVVLIIISTVLLIFSYPISVYIFKKPQLFLPLTLAVVYMFISSLEYFFTAFFFAAKKIQHTVTKEIIYQVSRILIIISILYFFLLKPKAEHIFIAMILAASLSLLFIIHKIGKENPYLFSNKTEINNKNRNRIVKFIIFVTFTSLTYTFLGHTDTIMLGLLLTDIKFIGYYNAAFALLSGIGGFIAFNKVLMPIFVQVKEKDLETAFNKSLRFNFIITIPAAAGLAFLSGHFLKLFFGAEYMNATPALRILSILVVVGVYSELLISLFAAKERPGDYLSLLVFVIVVNTILNYFFIKYFLIHTNAIPIIGAAIATSISSIIYAVGLTFIAKKKLNINVNLKSVIKPLSSALIMIFVLIFIGHFVNDINILNGIFLIILGALIYLFSLIVFKGLEKEDLLLIKPIFTKFKMFSQ
ncbi:polysaccharide biosynthesis protein [Candidatus Pacearchaeota archaeon]|nr:polysaccharide biosynthesis protein [Candidatus Pacearchaeota archaeon]